MGKRNFWMPVYVEAFVSDTTELSAAQTGAYFLLLAKQWQIGDLPPDDAQLARIARFSPEEWLANRDAILPFFDLGDDGRWVNRRMAEVRAEQRAKTEKRSAAGRKGNLSRWSKNKSDKEGQPNQPESPAAAPKPRGRKIKATVDNAPFEKFYGAYPRHEARVDAEKAWTQAIAKGHTPETIIAGLKNFCFSDDRKFIPLPASWIRGERWKDEPPAHGGAPASRQPPPSPSPVKTADGHVLTGAELFEVAT